MRPVVCALAALFCSAATAADTPGPQGAPSGPLREQIHHIPAGDGLLSATFMVATVYRPPGDDPRPLAVINHGSPGPSERATFRAASGWFVGRGYVVVVPTRRGYGLSGGSQVDGMGPCRNRDYHAAGLGTAEDIALTLAYMAKLPYVRSDRTLLIGQSAGGWGVMAASTLALPGVVAAINFSGGRDARMRCAPDQLVETASRYGSGSKIPMLWIYTENDRSFPPSTSKALHEAFTASGGRALYVLLPPFGKNGHRLFGSDDGVALWSSHVHRFLKLPSGG